MWSFAPNWVGFLVFERYAGGTFIVLLLTTNGSKACLIMNRLPSEWSDRRIIWARMIYSGQVLLLGEDIVSMVSDPGVS